MTMATYNKGSKQYKEIRSAKVKKWIRTCKEILIGLFILIATCVDLEPLFILIL